MFEGQYLSREMVNTGDADESFFTYEVSEVNPSKEQSLIQSEYLRTVRSQAVAKISVTDDVGSPLWHTVHASILL